MGQDSVVRTGFFMIKVSNGTVRDLVADDDPNPVRAIQTPADLNLSLLDDVDGDRPELADH